MEDNGRSGIPVGVWHDFETRNADGEAFKLAEFARMLEKAGKALAHSQPSKMTLHWGEIWEKIPLSEQ